MLDSFAWIEYFSGTPAGGRVRGFLETSSALTPTIVVAELSEKYRRSGMDFSSRYEFIKGRSRLVVLDEELARTAGLISFERKKKVKGWGMADSIVLATGRRSRAKIVTGDPHFEDLDGEVLQV